MGQFKLALTYFTQHVVERVGKTGDGWTIRFANGEIRSYDADAVQPEVKGAQLLDVEYGYGDHETTRLVFSNGAAVEIDPQQYSVTHALCGTCWPERDEEAESDLPADPSVERVAEGPTTPESEG